MLINSYSQDLESSPILIVDDEPVNLKLLDRILSAEGFTSLTTIENPCLVVEEYKKQRPHLIMLDINMPIMNGFDVLEKLKQINNTQLPPIIFITAQNAHDYRTKAFESGVLDFISKPFNRVELLSRVKNLLALESAHLALSERNNSLEAAFEMRTAALRKTQLQVVQRLGRAAEFRDNETGAHLSRMSNISALIATKLDFTEDESQQLLHASPMHDVGKIAIPDHILLKPSKFTDKEWEIMKSHTTLGYEILNGDADDSPLLRLASEIALSHHEKFDGSGYPNALSEGNIPISCRIVAVADVFDALLSERPYKKAWSLNDAQELINSESGKHFDPVVVNIFNQSFRSIMDIRNRFRDEEVTHESSQKIPLPTITSHNKEVSDEQRDSIQE